MSTVETRPGPVPASGGETGRARRRPPKQFDRPRFLKVFAGIFFLFLFAPIALVILFSFNSSRSLQDFQGFSLRWYELFFESESLRDSLIASIQIALITMVIATVLGTMLAYGLVRARTRWSDAANVMMLIPLVTPEIVAGASALLLFTQVGLVAVDHHDRARRTSRSRSRTWPWLSERAWPPSTARSRTRRWTSARRAGGHSGS